MSNGEDLADFLKREDEKMAEIEELGMMRTSPPPDTNGADGMVAYQPGSMSPIQILDEFSEQSQPPFVASTDPIEVTIQRRRSVEFIVPQRRSSLEAPPRLPSSSSNEDLYSGAATHEDISLFGGEPECIQTWRRQKEEMLDAKEAEASEEMRKWRENAQQEMSDWYDHHNSQVETRKQDNRAAEQAFVSERDQSIPGTEWEKVANLCDFSGKVSGKNSKDVSRMRSIYLHLKENPPIRN